MQKKEEKQETVTLVLLQDLKDEIVLVGSTNTFIHRSNSKLNIIILRIRVIIKW